MATKKKAPVVVDRLKLREDFVKLLHREQRFGLRDDCRSTLDAEWDAFLEMILG